MNNFLFSLLGFVFAIGFLTIIHEFGHFWVARRMGVKILRFSIGFGTPLISWRDKQDTEYVIAAIPLGGYVSMLDHNEAEVPASQLHLSHSSKPVWKRMLIIIAGPAFNIIFAILAYSVVFMLGITSIVPILGAIPKDSPAYSAGLRSGNEIIAINNYDTATWEAIAVAIMSQVGDNNSIDVKVRNLQDQQESTHALKLPELTGNRGEANVLKNLGFVPYDPAEPIVADVMPDMPAATAGLQAGDRIVSIDGITINSRVEIMDLLRTSTDSSFSIGIQRQQENLILQVNPVQKALEDGTKVSFLGVQFKNIPLPENLIRVQRYGPIIALQKGAKKTKEYSILTLQLVGKMLTGKISLQHVAGPVSIAKVAGHTVTAGIEHFLSFLALISISLGVLNMLPIPILDGGAFLFCLVELIHGKPLPKEVLKMGRLAGGFLIGAFMMLALYNDFLNF